MRYLLGLLALLISLPATAETTIKVGWCAKTISSAASPFAIAKKYGWFAERGLNVVVVPLAGATECVKEVATGDMLYTAPSIEPLVIIHPQGVKARMFYLSYQSFTYGIAVPADSPIKDFVDLKGKTIGVISMDSGGVVVARAQAAAAGLDPNRDIHIVVAGEGASTAALVRNKQVDALSQFDVQYAMIENAGVKLRQLDVGEMAPFPGNGFIATDETLRTHRDEAVALARGWAMGQVFAMANPEAAVRIHWEIYPQSRPTGKDEATALRDDVKVLQARQAHWRLESGGVTRWGESNIKNFDAYIAFLSKWKIVPVQVPANEIVTNDLIADINKFDVAAVTKLAEAFGK